MGAEISVRAYLFLHLFLVPSREGFCVPSSLQRRHPVKTGRVSKVA